MPLRFLFLAFSLFSVGAFAQNEADLVPVPVNIVRGEGSFYLSDNTKLIAKDSALFASDFLRDYLKNHFDIKLSTVDYMGDQNNAAIGLYVLPQPAKPSGYYELSIKPKEIQIRGEDAAGVFYGVQTLIQLLGTKSSSDPGAGIHLQNLSITDYPRFGYRGMHLDVSRHFFPVEYIKKFIDQLAMQKFNVFHWHLTDDQGWRVEIKKYPLLTEKGSCRDQTLVGRFGSDLYDGKKYCGFYSQDQIKDVVKYAADRFITIIPEIDVPGHSLAALASYPFLGCTKGPYKVRETWGLQDEVLCAGNDSTFRFFEDVFDEIIALFPSRYIHIGGDECRKERWKQCPVCQQRIRSENLKNENELQSYFIRRIEKHINDKGRSIIGWDETLEGGIAPNATIMSWRGEAGGIAAARQDHPVIMTPENPLYFNLSQSKFTDSITQGGYNPVENVYNYDPTPSSLEEQKQEFILGAQGCLWSEYLNNPAKLEYMAYPRMSALSEVLWSPKEKRNWAAFEKRLSSIYERYAFHGFNYSTAYYDLQPTVLPGEKGALLWKLFSNKKYADIIYTYGKETSATHKYEAPVVIKNSSTLCAALTESDNRLTGGWICQEFHINKATGKNVSLSIEPNTKYSGQGGFTLVDGVQNTMGMIKSYEFLGFIGKDKDLVATIDLGSNRSINEVKLHAFEQTISWIYRPASVSIFTSRNGKDFKKVRTITECTGRKNLVYTLKQKMQARYVKVVAKNNGIIAQGLAGAGSPAWLFIDEIEIR